MYRQYQLKQGDSVLMCWLEHDAKLTRGTSLTLKNVPGVWVVDQAYSMTTIDPPLTKWQVGGLA
jgi:hypothetical protein